MKRAISRASRRRWRPMRRTWISCCSICRCRACAASRPPVPARRTSRPADHRRLRQRGSRGDAPLPRIRRGGLRAEIARRRTRCARRSARCSTAANGRRPISTSTRRSQSEASALVRRLSSLTPQQVRVLMMLSQGLLNKQIAYELSVLRGDGEGACLGDPAEARRREPHPGGHPRRQDRARAGTLADGLKKPPRALARSACVLRLAAVLPVVDQTP